MNRIITSVTLALPDLDVQANVIDKVTSTDYSTDSLNNRFCFQRRRAPTSKTA